MSYSQSGSGNQQYNAQTINFYDTRQQGFSQIANWLSRSDPWTSHDSALRQHESGTGSWLLQCDPYQRWKHGLSRHLWLHGKAGCGKTVLCSTVIEDLQNHCRDNGDIGLALFYFSFSDDRKQSEDDLVPSLLAQLGCQEPAVSTLRQAYSKPDRRVPATDELETILCSAIEAHSSVYIVLDALDECPKESGIRQSVLARLERLAQHAPKIKIFATSRELYDIRLSMESLPSEEIPILERTVDTDIHKYLSVRLSSDRRLSRLDPETKYLVETKIAEKAEGMFRYASLQLQEIEKLDSHRPSKVRKVLERLPTSLDGIYARILMSISEDDHDDAIVLLQWLAYAREPLTLGQLNEVVIIDCDKNIVDIADRGGVEDALNILSGLVMVIRGSEGNSDNQDQDFEPENLENEVEVGSEVDLIAPRSHIQLSTRIRLAHFSVKEYLESTRITKKLTAFHLKSTEAHHLLTQSCLTYLMHFSNSDEKLSTYQDLDVFPLLHYAARSWYHHSSLHQHSDVGIETRFLQLHDAMCNWLPIHWPDAPLVRPYEEGGLPEDVAHLGLYYASYLGLLLVVKGLLDNGADVNAKGGTYGNALQAASREGHIEVVELLLDHGAEINATNAREGDALQAASGRGRIKVVKLLLDRGANIHAEGGAFGENALQTASSRGHIGIVKLLLDRGADIHAEGGAFGQNAFEAATSAGHIEVVKLLLDRGAEIDPERGRYGEEALRIASIYGHTEVAKLLLNRGADIYAEINADRGNALQAASSGGHIEAVRLLLDLSAEINAERGKYDYALHTASRKGLRGRRATA